MRGGGGQRRHGEENLWPPLQSENNSKNCAVLFICKEINIMIFSAAPHRRLWGWENMYSLQVKCGPVVQNNRIFRKNFVVCLKRGQGKHIYQDNCKNYYQRRKITVEAQMGTWCHSYQVLWRCLQHNFHLNNWDWLQDQDHWVEREEDQASDLGHCWPGWKASSKSEIVLYCHPIFASLCLVDYIIF